MICRDYPPLKIVVPEMSEMVLPRREIITAIDNAPLETLTYVTAPYGCGKTLAVISWLREHQKEAAWVTLGERDNTQDALCRLLTGSILRLAGEQEKADSIVQSTKVEEDTSLLLSETLIRLSPVLKSMILIVDNCHVLRDTDALRDIRGIIYNMLGCWRVIFIGRGELPPAFNDLILKKCLRKVTLDELSFTQDEIAVYFQMHGYSVAKNDLIRIREETDGWPAALNAILTSPHNGTVEYNFTDRSYVMGYFETEIWKPLDEITKNFFLKTAILDKLTPSICHSLTGVEETYSVLGDLFASGLFLLKLEEFNSYYYHRVFKEFLLYKLNSSDIDINELYIKVGWWLYERNESVSALLYFYKAGNISGINQAFKKVRPANIGMDKYVETCACLMRLNVTDLKAYPEVAARIALLFFVTNNIAEVKRIYHIALDWLSPGVLVISPENYSDFSWEVGWLRYLNPDEDIFFNGLFEKWANVKDFAPNMLENDRSRASALRLPSVLRGGRDYSVNVSQTEEYYKMICNSGSITDEDGLFVIDLIMAEIYYEREEFSKAEALINKNISEIERAKQTELYFVCTVLLVKILRATYKMNGIDKLIERLETMIRTNGHLYLLSNFHAYEVRNRLADGEQGMTEIFEKENRPHEDKTYFYMIYRKITFVRALLSEKKFNEANMMLRNLDLLCHQYKRNADLIEVNILHSIAEYGLEHFETANEFLVNALDAGRKCGFIRIFADDAISLSPILNLLHKGEIDGYIESIIISCKKSIAFMETIPNTEKPLTKAEREVLKLLIADLTYPQMATARNVGIHTIKSQISSIYSKLGVSSKVSAVIKADKLRLFESD